MIIRNLGHASFQIITNGRSIVFDPYSDGAVPGLTYPKNIVTDILLISHEHVDHSAKNNVACTYSNIPGVNIKEFIVPHDHENGLKRGMNKIHLIDVEGYRVAHMGDIGCMPSQDIIASLKGVDIMLIPINGNFTVSSEEAKQIAIAIKPRLVIPMHYYRKDMPSGYPDSNQIDVFKKCFPRHIKIRNTEVEVSENLFNYDGLIFEGLVQ